MKNLNQNRSTPLQWRIEQGENSGLFPLSNGMTLKDILDKVSKKVDHLSTTTGNSGVVEDYAQLSNDKNNDNIMSYPPPSCKYFKLVQSTIKKAHIKGTGEKLAIVQFSYAASLYKQFTSGSNETDQDVQGWYASVTEYWTLKQSKIVQKTLEQKGTVEEMIGYLTEPSFEFPNLLPSMGLGPQIPPGIKDPVYFPSPYHCLPYLLGFEILTAAVVSKWPGILS